MPQQALSWTGALAKTIITSCLISMTLSPSSGSVFWEACSIGSKRVQPIRYGSLWTFRRITACTSVSRTKRNPNLVLAICPNQPRLMEKTAVRLKIIIYMAILWVTRSDSRAQWTSFHTSCSLHRVQAINVLIASVSNALLNGSRMCLPSLQKAALFRRRKFRQSKRTVLQC